jgi:gamma-glutamyltranspeptidase/glutathione hydrolase
MPWRDLLSPAVRLARLGLPVDWFTTIKVAAAAADLRRYDESRRVWLPDGLPPVPPPEAQDPRLPLGRLPEALERLAEAGPDDFYQGEIAHSIAADVRTAGGVLSAEDLAGCRARIVPALEIPYRGTKFQAAPGMTAGPTLARVLEQLAKRRFADAPDAGFFEAVIEALRNAYVERLRGMGDVEAGLATSTTHITAVDREGGIAALTTTLLSSFGSRCVLPRTGILMNNGVMWFDPQPGRPNSIGPGKRALTNMCPVIVARDRQPWFGAAPPAGGAFWRRYCSWRASLSISGWIRKPQLTTRALMSAAEIELALMHACRSQLPLGCWRNRAQPSLNILFSPRASPARTSCCATATGKIEGSLT